MTYTNPYGSIRITDFSSNQEMDYGEDIVPIEGWLVHEGVFNRQTFTKEELERAAPTFIGRPIVKDHKKGVDDVIGKIMNTEFRLDDNLNLYGVYYYGGVGSEHTKLIKDIRRGFVSDTSMRVGYNKPITETHVCNICGKKVGSCSHGIENPDFNPYATGFYGKHLSVVTEPADRQTSVAVSFEDENGHVYDDITQFLGRTNMSEQFEEKYIKLMDEFNEFKDAKRVEIDELNAGFKDQKTQLEKDFADKVEENLKLQNDFNDLKTEKEALEEKVKGFESEFAKIEEEKLSGLRTKVTELNDQVHGNLTEDQINSFEEATLEHYVGLFTSISENMTTTVRTNVDPTNNYSDNHETTDFEDADDHIGNLTNLVQNM